MDGFCCPDSRNVSIPLIRENQPIGQRPFEPRGDCRSPAMGCLAHVDVKIVVGEDRAACRGDPDGDLLKLHFIDHLCDNAMQNAVAAPRAVVEWIMLERLGPGKNLPHAYPSISYA